MDPLGSIKEVFIVIVLILMNGLLAMLEMALVSARKSRLEQLADEGSSKAAYILKLAQEPTEFLSTVQIGITLVGIGTGDTAAPCWQRLWKDCCVRSAYCVLMPA